MKTSAYESNSNLKNKTGQGYQWKIPFYPGLIKQTQKAVFSREVIKTFHSQICFNLSG